MQAPRVILVGLGKPDEFHARPGAAGGATAVRKARELGVRSLATVLHGAGTGDLAPRQAAQALAEGSLLGAYRFDRLKSRNGGDDDGERPEIWSAWRSWSSTSTRSRKSRPDWRAGASWRRAPSSRAISRRSRATSPTPRVLAEAQEMAGQTGLRCEVLEPAQMAELKMGALLGVAQGSDEPARFVILEHNPEGAGAPPVVLWQVRCLRRYLVEAAACGR